MSRMTTVKKQNNQTWANLHSRLRSTAFSYHSLFPNSVGDFFRSHALALSSCEGYVFDSVLASTAYLLSEKCNVIYNGFSSKTNLYVVFVGPPSTGKSQAINCGSLDPLAAVSLARDSKPIVLGKSTSAGLVQRLSEGGTMLVSSEMYDVLHKMVKTDAESGSGDIAMLCQVFSGETVSITYATQQSREIPADRAFCMLGAIQPSPVAKLLTSLDNGNGFIERLLLHFPNCLRPSPSSTREAKTLLSTKPTLSQVLQVVHQVHENGIEYVFDSESEQQLDRINEAYIDSINAAILEASPPPQSKKLDLILRVAPPIHVLSSVVQQMLDEVEPTTPNRTITKTSLDSAVKFVEFCESQKETYLCELRNITDVILSPEVQQPNQSDVTKAVLKSPGPVITYRSFKGTCRKALRSVGHAEYATALLNLHEMGTSSTHRMEPSGKIINVFIKAKEATINWDEQWPLTRQEYITCFEKKQPACITAAMQTTLINAGKCSREMFQ